MFDLIAFDADDTLWHNETLYTDAQAKLMQLLSAYHSAEWIELRLYQTEMRNIRIFGYGIKSFTLSMIETAIELTEGRIQGGEIQQIIDFGRQMLEAPIQLLEHVVGVIAGLAASYPLALITKGDLFDQETKLARSGLADYFKHVEIVSQKTRETYAEILSRHQVRPGHFLMVGNSLKSDILPVLELGAQAVYIPYALTWAHEIVEEIENDQPGFYRIEHIGLLPELIEKVAG